jgi:hypothetical protein
MQWVAPMWEAAGFLGMSEKTLRDTYGHHHPDHLRGAANAIGSRPTPKKVALVVSLVDEKAKSAGLLKTPVPSVYAFAPLKLRRTRFGLTVSAWLRRA